MDQVVVTHAYSPPEFDSVKQLANATARVVRVRFRWSCAATEMANLVCCILAPCSLESFVLAVLDRSPVGDGFDSLGSFFIQGFVHSDSAHPGAFVPEKIKLHVAGARIKNHFIQWFQGIMQVWNTFQYPLRSRL
jgi:hypothetical protein